MNRSRLLVVDDNPTNLKLVSDLLEFEGYEILKASDAEEAIAVIGRTPPDLILMDIALPGMDGLTLTRKLKSDENTRHIGVVALTAFAMKGDEQKAIAAGCDGYISKPVDTRKLPEIVARHLSHTQQPGAGSGIKVLVIEDQPSQLKLASHVLSAEGHQVTNAATGEQAMEVIKRDPPQVILLDLSLPDTDGLSLARKLKADPATSAIHLIAITAYPERFSKATVMGAGCDAYLTKPVNTRALPQMVADIAKSANRTTS